MVPTVKMCQNYDGSLASIHTEVTGVGDMSHVLCLFVCCVYQMAWTPFLAALSLALRDSDNMQMITLCLEGFRCAIRVASIFDMAVSL